MSRHGVLRVLLGAVLVMLAGLGALVACTGDGGSDPDPGPGMSAGPSGSASGSAQPRSPAELAEEYLVTTPPEPVGAAAGTVRTTSGSTPATAEVLQVRSMTGSTVLRWRLKVPDTSALVLPGTLAPPGEGARGTDWVRLVSRAADYSAYPATYESVTIGDCTCAPMPQQTGPNGVEMSGIYPALPEGASEVEVRIRGFPAITVPVERS